MIAAIYIVIGSVLMFIIPDQGKKMTKKVEEKKEAAEPQL